MVQKSSLGDEQVQIQEADYSVSALSTSSPVHEAIEAGN